MYQIIKRETPNLVNAMVEIMDGKLVYTEDTDRGIGKTTMLLGIAKANNAMLLKPHIFDFTYGDHPNIYYVNRKDFSYLRGFVFKGKDIYVDEDFTLDDIAMIKRITNAKVSGFVRG